MDLVDKIILFQGDTILIKILKIIDSYGLKRAKELISKVNSCEKVPYESWAVPDFKDFNFDDYIGIPIVPYVSTRGCYWSKCSFCAISLGWSKNGYAGSSPAFFVVEQIRQIIHQTKIYRIKFVDEALSPVKVLQICEQFNKLDIQIEWEAYARLEKEWEDFELLEKAYKAGLRKLYFGLEQVNTKSRILLMKNDNANIENLLEKCNKIGIKIHLFCMVGYPGTKVSDAQATVEFLIENEMLIDTADLVGFRLDRGIDISGVKTSFSFSSDWLLSMPYESTKEGILNQKAVLELEAVCQEKLWQYVPRFLHPLYRIIGHWDINSIFQ